MFFNIESRILILSDNDGYFLQKNNNQKIIDKMLEDNITNVANKKNLKLAWDEIFKYFNNQKGRGKRGYQKNETVFIKINLGCANWNDSRPQKVPMNKLFYFAEQKIRKSISKMGLV